MMSRESGLSNGQEIHAAHGIGDCWHRLSVIIGFLSPTAAIIYSISFISQTSKDKEFRTIFLEAEERRADDLIELDRRELQAES